MTDAELHDRFFDEASILRRKAITEKLNAALDGAEATDGLLATVSLLAVMLVRHPKLTFEQAVWALVTTLGFVRGGSELLIAAGFSLDEHGRPKA